MYPAHRPLTICYATFWIFPATKKYLKPKFNRLKSITLSSTICTVHTLNNNSYFTESARSAFYDTNDPSFMKYQRFGIIRCFGISCMSLSSCHRHVYKFIIWCTVLQPTFCVIYLNLFTVSHWEWIQPLHTLVHFIPFFIHKRPARPQSCIMFNFFFHPNHWRSEHTSPHCR